MIDRFTAEVLQATQNLPEEARQSGLEIGRALGRAIDDIPELEALAATLESAGVCASRREALNRHLSTLRVFRRFVERAKAAVESMPTA